MNTILIISAVIVWFIVGYFVNVLALKINNFIMGWGFNDELDSDDIKLCFSWIIIFPLFSILWVSFGLTSSDRERLRFDFLDNLLQKLTDWHNKKR